MKLRKLAATAAASAALLIGGAATASAYPFMPGANAPDNEVHVAVSQLVTNSNLADDLLVTGNVDGWGLANVHLEDHLLDVTGRGWQAIKVADTVINHFHGLYVLNNHVWTPLTTDGTANEFGGAGSPGAGQFHTHSGSTIIVLNPTFLNTVTAGQALQLAAVFDHVDLGDNAFAVTFGATGTRVVNNVVADNRPEHPATGPVTALYAVGGVLLGSAGMALLGGQTRNRRQPQAA